MTNTNWIENTLNKLSPDELLQVLSKAEAKYGSGVKIVDVKKNENGKYVVVQLPSNERGLIVI